MKLLLMKGIFINQTAKIYQAKSIDEFIKALPAGGAEIIRKEKGDINQNKYN